MKLLLALLVLMNSFFEKAIAAMPKEDSLMVFDRTIDLINQNFYDKTFRQLPWEKMIKSSRAKIEKESSMSIVSEEINYLLAELNASHTKFVSFKDQEFWALESIFSGELDGAPLRHIGAWFTKIDQKWFVQYILEKSPAHKAGLLRGDEIISVNSKVIQPVESFNGQSINSVKIRRNKNGPPLILTVNTINQSFQRAMLQASKESFKIISKCGGKKLAYFHLWSGSNDESLSLLSDIAKKAQSESDGFILDLRDGFGGAYPAFLNPFYSQDDTGKPISQIFTKPMVVLINDGVRSGKEWIANILKTTKRATLVGEKTKGYFLSGRLFKVVPGKYDLYLAVDKPKPPAPDLEGLGVSPDVEVNFDLPYSAGQDPQFDRAVMLLGQAVSKDLCK